MRTCNKCKSSKPLSEFHKDKKATGGYRYACKPCLIKQAQAYYYRKGRKRLMSLKGRVGSYKGNAKYRGLDYSLSDQLATSLLSANCHYCGESGYGIDRLNSSKGYVQSNCVPCCTTCNIMKNTLGHDVFIHHCRKITQNHMATIIVDNQEIEDQLLGIT